VHLDRLGEREHGLADVATLLAVVWLAVVKWSSLAGAAAVPLWKPSACVGLTVLFSLAALTRHARWARSIRLLLGRLLLGRLLLGRLLLGGWLVAAPFLFRFDGIAPALWRHVTFGLLLVFVSMPGIIGPRAGRQAALSLHAATRWDTRLAAAPAEMHGQIRRTADRHG
jgi:hypothetical protein